MTTTETATRCPTCYEPDQVSHDPIVRVTMADGRTTATINLVDVMLARHPVARLAAVAPAMLATARARARIYLTCAERRAARERARRPEYAAHIITESVRQADARVSMAKDLIAYVSGEVRHGA